MYVLLLKRKHWHALASAAGCWLGTRTGDARAHATRRARSPVARHTLAQPEYRSSGRYRPDCVRFVQRLHSGAVSCEHLGCRARLPFTPVRGASSARFAPAFVRFRTHLVIRVWVTPVSSDLWLTTARAHLALSAPRAHWEARRRPRAARRWWRAHPPPRLVPGGGAPFLAARQRAPAVSRPPIQRAACCR